MWNMAVVTQVLPDRHGVLVAYRNGVELHPNVGSDADLRFVQVLERRAHNAGGATVCLPEVGELGLVLDVDPANSVWLGSIPWAEANQMDPRPGLEGWRHASGVQVLVLGNGDTQFWHPTGISFSITRDGAPVQEMQGSIPVAHLSAAEGSPDAYVSLYHPSGFTMAVDPLGALSVDSPSTVTLHSKAALVVNADDNATVTVGKDLAATVTGKLTATVTGNATLKAAKIVLDGPVECTSTLKVTGDATISGKSFVGHKHGGVQGGGAQTSVPV